MDKVVDAIRDLGVGVEASVLTVDTTTGEKAIVLKSQATGEDGIIASISDTTGSLMADLGLAQTSAVGAFSANTTVEGTNARFTLDGIEMVSSSNEVEGVMDGVVLRLRSPSYDQATENPVNVDLTIEYDREGLKEKVGELLGAYNEMLDYLNQKLRHGDENGENRGELAGDLTFTSFRMEMKLALTRRLGAEHQVGQVNSLDDVGLTMARDGKLTLSDEEAFFNALTANPESVEAFFGSEDGIFKRVEGLVTAFTKIGGGLDLARNLVDSKKDVLDLRIERQENLLTIREKQLVQELARLSQFVAQIGAQQQAFGGLIGY
jgi:flagellar hook-associated protein 2